MTSVLQSNCISDEINSQHKNDITDSIQPHTSFRVTGLPEMSFDPDLRDHALELDSPMAMIARFLTARRPEDSCGKRASCMDWWKLTSSGPNLLSKSARMSNASNCTDTSVYRVTINLIIYISLGYGVMD